MFEILVPFFHIVEQSPALGPVIVLPAVVRISGWTMFLFHTLHPGVWCLGGVLFRFGFTSRRCEWRNYVAV